MYTTGIIMPEKKMIDIRRFWVKTPLSRGEKVKAKSATTSIVARVPRREKQNCFDPG